MSNHQCIAGPVCLVVVADPLLAMDLGQGIAEVDPECDTIVVADMVQALARLGPGTIIVKAIVEASPCDLDASPLGRMLSQCQAQVVLLGQAAEAETPDPRYPVLVSPIFAEDLRALMQRRLCLTGNP